MENLPRIIKRECLAAAKWLRLELLHYVDRQGNERKWEAAQRVNSRGAALMIAGMRLSGEIILIRQYRPAAEKYVIEFPAGLIDPGENPAETAVRELLEETGYHGTVKQVSPPGFNSPGMTGEVIYSVVMEIDDGAPRNREPAAQQEESEDIETFLVKKSGLEDFIQAAVAKGWGVDAKVVAYAIASCSNR